MKNRYWPMGGLLMISTNGMKRKKITLRTFVLSIMLLLLLTMVRCATDSPVDVPDEGDDNPDGDDPDGDFLDCTKNSDCSFGQICKDGECIYPMLDDDDDDNNDDNDDNNDDSDNAAQISVPFQLDFGAVRIGNEMTKQLEIASIGSLPLVISSVDLDGSTSDEFSLVEEQEWPITLQTNETTIVKVKYSPENAGVDDGLLKIFSNDQVTPVTDVILATNYKGEADLVPDPIELAMGDAAIFGDPVRLCVELTNVPREDDSNRVISISSIVIEPDESDPHFTLEPFTPNTILAPEQIVSACVQFHPQALGEFEHQLIVHNDETDEEDHELSIPITGQGVAPAIVVAPDSVNFGNVQVGIAMHRRLVIANTGSSPLTLLSVTPKEGTSADFTIDLLGHLTDETGEEIAPSEQLEVEIVYTPDAVGGDSGFIVVESDSYPTATIEVPVSGFGVEPFITLDPTSIGFGSRLVGTETDLTLSLQNDGESQVCITALTIAPSVMPFTIIEPPALPLCLANTDPAVSLTIRYAPATEELHDANLTIEVGPDSLDIPLSGTGVLPHAVVDPVDGSIDFGNVRLGEVASFAISIENDGGYNLEILDPHFTLGSSADFSFEVEPVESVLGPFQSGSLSISYAPPVDGLTGEDTGGFIFSTSDTDFGEFQYSLSGIAINPILQVIPTSGEISFGEILSGVAAEPKHVEVRNVGIGPLEISDIRMNEGSAASFGIVNLALNEMPDPTFPIVLDHSDQVVAFDVTFTPQGISPYEGAVMIENSDFDNQEYLLMLTGEGVDCAEGEHRCGDGCVMDNVPETCGNRCTPCPDEEEHGSASCEYVADEYQCGIECDPGYLMVNDVCQPNNTVDCCGENCDSCLPHPANGTAICRDGECGFTCDNGYHKEGDECVLNDSPDCCGQSCTQCTAPENGDPVCLFGNCSFNCVEDYHRCGDVCLWDLSPNSCGPNSCDPCPAPEANGQATCSETFECGIDCAPGYHQDGYNCLANDIPGCCGQTCEDCTELNPPNSVAVCVDGSCDWNCQTDYNECGSVCISRFNIDHCNGCDNDCPDPEHGQPTCDGTSCGIVCDASYHLVGLTCVANDDATCCGTECENCNNLNPANSTAFCENGACGWECNPGYHQDGQSCLLNNTVDCCGTNCTVCPTRSHASRACEGGSCVYDCIDPWTDCNFDLNDSSSNGCETELGTTSNCLSCGNSCTAPSGATATCNASSGCDWNCSSGYTECGGSCWQVIELQYGVQRNVNTCASTNHLSGYSCWSGGSTKEVIFKWVPDRSDEVVVGSETTNSWDQALVALSGNPCSSTCQGYSDSEYDGTGVQEYFYLTGVVGQPFYFTLEGYGGDCGSANVGIATEEDLGCESTGQAQYATFVLVMMAIFGWLAYPRRRRKDM